MSRATVRMDSFYARTASQVESTVAEKLNPGDYAVDVSLESSASQAHVDTRGLGFSVAGPAKNAAVVLGLIRRRRQAAASEGLNVSMAPHRSLTPPAGATPATRLRR